MVLLFRQYLDFLEFLGAVKLETFKAKAEKKNAQIK